MGIPEEVLTDQGTQFMSECMQEVSRLLSKKGLTIMPYHPICKVKTSYKYVTELRERLGFIEAGPGRTTEVSESYKKHYDKKAKSRCLEEGDQVLNLLSTDSNKLLM